MRVLMNRPSSARAPKGAGREGRRSSAGARGLEWVRFYQRAQRALDNSASLIFSTVYAVVDAGRCAERRPLGSARKLTCALRQMVVASTKVAFAKFDLAAAAEALARVPEALRGDALELLELAVERCRAVEEHISIATGEVLLGASEVMAGIATGELVPEKDPSVGPPRRIILAPRPLFVRAFLASRQARVADRIRPILLRRRRTLRPAEVRVPRRNLRGRAPPFSSTCAL